MSFFFISLQLLKIVYRPESNFLIKMNEAEKFEFLESLIPKHEWNEIFKISIFYEEFLLLKLLLLVNSKWLFHRKYFLRVTFKNNSIKRISISYNQKKLIKPYITNFNFYVNSLAFSEED